MRIAWPLAALTVALAVAGGALAAGNGAALGDVSHLPAVAACAVTGGLLARRRPGNAVGPLLLLSAWSFALQEACGQAATRWDSAALAWPQTWLWVPANLGLALVPLYFPDGRLAPRARPAVVVLLGLAAVAAVTGALRPGVNDQVGPSAPANPLGVAALGGVAPVAEGLFTIAAGLCFVAGAAAVVWRARSRAGVAGAQARWLAYPVGLVALVVLVRLGVGLLDADPGRIWPASDSLWNIAGGLASALIPAGIGIAVLRHRLFDIDLLISRTAVFVALSAAVAAAYLLVVGVLGASSVIAAVAAALVFGALRQWMQQRINLLVYGERDDPYTVLARLGERLATVPDPGAILAAGTVTVREALQLSYVGIFVGAGRSYELGRRPADPVALPLVAGGEPVGELLLGPRPGEATLGPRDLRLLRDLAGHLGVAVQAVRYSADLQHSREQLVLAREEERRRLRRDLHDGLGPTLAALTMRAEAAQEVGGEAAQRLLEEIVTDTQTALADVRRIIEGLRPPALDTLGLVGAIRAHVASWPAGPRVVLDAPDDIVELPAAAEVAAYRIAVEALANARRHAGASTVRVAVAVDGDALTLSVHDDGAGAGSATPGVGMHSMRERAAELGGTLVFGTGDGTTVTARLPLGAAR
ncbi:sensor histidine kinase [Dactylosporangium sp. AC04546]|uniref:sensor histidine kinase n=1 Tax=Dactylosporangium sp. AC04546 TaxID=2862460 RepID=UPI001EDEC49B|nr:sensor histidine kinase [Dactylosporangium sp. AC04546]WVK89202.1 sensor histidine kinase [Dactylosporangium sp. AC04546]